ncbi:MAG: aminoglycoside 3-N-acetyltransferase [Saprospiraceae bacterium]
MEQNIITHSQLFAQLRELGVAPGDTLMLHVSVKAVGWIVGGPEVFLDALLDVLGSEGTLMMLAGWEDYPYHLSEWPPEQQQAYREACPAFDPEHSRAHGKEFSRLCEYLRTRKKGGPVFRSAHPSCSVVATGKQATWLCADHPLQYGFGERSPFAKLCEAGGWVLNIGAPLDTFTVLHYAEHRSQIANKRIARYQMPILVNGSRTWVDLEEFDSSNGIVDWDGEDYFELIAKDFIAARAIPECKVGEAISYRFSASQLCDFGQQWMEAHFTGID